MLKKHRCGYFLCLGIIYAISSTGISDLEFTKLGDLITDEQYAQYLRSRLKKVSPNHPDLLLMPYIDYLLTGSEASASKFINGLKALKKAPASKSRKRPPAIFEGDLKYCWPSSFRKNEVCHVSVGSLTYKYLVPRLKGKDVVARQIFDVYRNSGGSDGAEGEAISELLGEINAPSPKPSSQ